MDETLDPAGVAVFIAVVCGVVALSCTRPELWGYRRLAFGAGIASASIGALQLSPSMWWFSGILWGIHQSYLGGSYVLRRRRTTHERLEYIESSASVLAYVALADGAIGRRERVIIRETYARAGFSPQDLAEVERTVRECERRFLADGADPERLFVLLRSSCAVVVQHTNQQTRGSFMRAAMLIAASDGFVSATEDGALRASAHWLGMTEVDCERLWREILGDAPRGSKDTRKTTSQNQAEADGEPVVPPDLATYYASILGVQVSASATEIKRAYREKAKQYHPDVVTHKGPVFAREAEEKFKELSRAYAFLRGGAIAT